MPEFTVEVATEALTDPINLTALTIMLLMIAFWYSARVWQTPEFVTKRTRFFDPSLTQKLQQRFNSPSLDKFTSFFWFQVFTLSIMFQWVICLFQGADAWRYGIPILSAVLTSFSIQLLFPVVVPIRYRDFGRDAKVRLVRLETMEVSDKINGLLYNGLPSNHLGMILTGGWLAFAVYLVDPWVGWLVVVAMFLVFVVIFAFSVLYLGEHYWQDLLAAALVYLTMLTGVKLMIDWAFPDPVTSIAEFLPSLAVVLVLDVVLAAFLVILAWFLLPKPIPVDFVGGEEEVVVVGNLSD